MSYPSAGQRRLTYGMVLIWGMFFGMFLPWWALPATIALVAVRAVYDIWHEELRGTDE